MMSYLKSYSSWQFIRDVVSFTRPYKRKFWLGIFIRASSDICRLYPAWALSQIVLLLTRLHDPATLFSTITILFLWGFTTLYVGVTHDYAKYLGYQVAENSSLDLYKRCIKHIFTLDLAWQELEGSGNKMKKIDRGHDGMNETIRRLYDTLIEIAVNTIGIIFIFFTRDKLLSFSLIFFVLTYFLLGTYLLRKANEQEELVNTKFENLSGITFESLNNIQTIKSLAIDQGIIGVIHKQSTLLIEQIRKRILLYRVQSGVLNSYYGVFKIVAICLLIWGIWHGYYTISLLVLFIGLFEKVGESSDELTTVIQQMVVNKVWVGRAMALLRIAPIIEHPKREAQQVEYPSEWKTLRIVNIQFSYKKGQALNNISFDIQRGESVGIVGLSGAGKSTLFKLLLDLYEDYNGNIYLDATPLKQIRRQSYIDHVAVVLQDTELFNMSLEENITIGNIHAATSSSLDEIISMSHLEDVVKNLNEGVKTLVGEKGVKLSGGQRQRVGIARALYRQPDILLLDEATSHLDAHSEKLIQQALDACMHKFTTIVIAHRLATIQKMDKIVVLEKGSIKEIGTFKELIEKNGSFAQMWKEQKL